MVELGFKSGSAAVSHVLKNQQEVGKDLKAF